MQIERSDLRVPNSEIHSPKKVSEVAILAEQFFNDHHVRVAEAAPLTTSDKTLLFTNSSIAPFKDSILGGEEIPETLIVQPCFRHRSKEDYFYYFTMFGLVAAGDQLEKCADELLSFLSVCGIEKSQLMIVLQPEDPELLSWASRSFPKEKIHSLSENHPKFTVRWKFGQEELSGRGLTVAARLPGSETYDPMSPDCIPLGNIILVENGKREVYVDIGMGIECLLSYHFKGDLFSLPEIKEKLVLLETLGFSELQAKSLLKNLQGIEMLRREGVTIQSKGAGYVLKKMVKDVYEILEAGFSPHLLDSYFQDQNFANWLSKELIKIHSAQVKAEPKAKSWLHNEKERIVTHLQGTFGLTLTRIRTILTTIFQTE